MKKRIVAFVTLLLALLVAAGCARTSAKNSWSRIKQTKKVVIGLDDSFVPMGFRQKDGSLAGYDIDLARAVFKLYGVTPSFQTIDWSMKETELRNQTIDLIWNGYTVTPARAKQVGFSNAYLLNHQVLVTKTSANIKSFADMKGKTLGVQTSSSGSADLDNEPKKLKDLIAHKTPVLYDTFDDAFLDLNAGRIQGILIDQVYGDYYVKHQADPGAYRIVAGTFPPEDFAVGLRKSDTTLKRKIDAGIKILAKNGTLERINEKWFGEKKVD